MSGKKISAVGRVWLIVLILLPTILSACVFYIIYNNMNFSEKNVYDIKLYDFSGEEIASESGYIRNAEKNGLISLFSPITENLNVLYEIPEYIERSRFLKAEVNYMNTKREFEFYFSIYDMIGYCVLDGNSYALAERDTTRLLSSAYAESLYENAVPPQLSTFSDEEILPKSVSWSYSTATGDYSMSNRYKVTEYIYSYDMSGSLGLIFSMEPDECDVTITKGDTVIYEGGYKEISQLTFERGEIVHVCVDAHWNYSTEAECYGTVAYEFDVEVSDRPVFTLTGDTFDYGTICGIYCTNVKDASKIVFEAVPSFEYTPEFKLSQGKAIAFLPIVYGESDKEHTIFLTYGATTEKFVITVNPKKEGGEIEFFADQANVKTALSYFSSDEYSKLRDEVAQSSNREKMFYGEFLDYSSLDAVKTVGFGDIYVGSYRSFYSYGNEYRFSENTDVRVQALNNGQVIKTGYNEYLGNYAVVTHGCGLATWYAHLSSIDVNEGSFVVKGEMIGKTGKTGLSTEENAFIMVSVGSSFVNPDSVCGKNFFDEK